MRERRVLVAVGIGINGESKRNAAETRQGGDGGGVGVVGVNQVHEAAADGAAVVAGAGQFVEGGHGHAAGGSGYGIGRPVCHEARARRHQRRHCAAVAAPPTTCT